jgi:hypothetical protein
VFFAIRHSLSTIHCFQGSRLSSAALAEVGRPLQQLGCWSLPFSPAMRAKKDAFYVFHLCCTDKGHNL